MVSVKGLARTSQTPGKTQTINFFQVDQSFYLADLPGYGFAKAPMTVRRQWQQLIESYLAGRPVLRTVVLIVDARHEPMAADAQLKAWLDHYGVPYIMVATKADKLPYSRQLQAEKALRAGFGVDRVVLYSALNGTGRDALWQIIRSRLHASQSAS